MNQPLWSPSADSINSSNLARFIELVNQRHGLNLALEYPQIHSWSISQPEQFWTAVWDFCGVIATDRGQRVFAPGDSFQSHRWFPDAKLNFAENLLRYRDERTALVG